MKLKYLLLLIAGITLQAHSQTTLFFEDFEDATTGYQLTVQQPFNPNGNLPTSEFVNIPDYAGRVQYNAIDLSNGDIFNQQGSTFFGVQDAGNNDTIVSLTWSNVDISNYTSLNFSAFWAERNDGAEDWDPVENVQVFATFDSGIASQIFGISSEDSTANSSRPLIDTDFDGIGDSTEITETLAQHSVGISGTGNLLDLEIRITGLGGPDEDIAFDNVLLTGIPIPEPSSAALLGFGGLALLGRRRRN